MASLNDTNTTTDSDRAEVVITDEDTGTQAKVSDCQCLSVKDYMAHSLQKRMLDELIKLNKYMEMITGG